MSINRLQPDEADSKLYEDFDQLELGSLMPLRTWMNECDDIIRKRKLRAIIVRLQRRKALYRENKSI